MPYSGLIVTIRIRHHELEENVLRQLALMAIEDRLHLSVLQSDSQKDVLI